MVHPTLTGSLGLLALLEPALAMKIAPVNRAANPPAKTECQQNVDDHGELYISTSSMSEYRLSCNTDHYGGDLDHVGSDSFLGCSGVCDANPDCIGYAYTPGNCWLKQTYTRKEVSSNVDFALNVQRNLTAKPYQEPAKPAPASGSCGHYDENNLLLHAKGVNFDHDNIPMDTDYQFKCGTDHPGGDIGAVEAKTFDSCVGICDATVDCIGFAWVGGNGPGECYLKGRITEGETNSNVDFASKRSATKKFEVETSTSVVASTSVVVSTSVSVVVPPPSPPSSSSPPPTLSTSVSIAPETPSESSTPLATVTETRTVWTLTGASSVPVATVTETRILFTGSIPNIKSYPTVPIKSLPMFSHVPVIAPTGFSTVAGNASNSTATSTSKVVPIVLPPPFRPVKPDDPAGEKKNQGHKGHWGVPGLPFLNPLLPHEPFRPGKLLWGNPFKLGNPFGNGNGNGNEKGSGNGNANGGQNDEPEMVVTSAASVVESAAPSLTKMPLASLTKFALGVTSAPSLTVKPFSSHWNDPVSTKESGHGGIFGNFNSILKSKPATTSNSTVEDLPSSTYISAPSVTRELPTLGAGSSEVSSKTAAIAMAANPPKIPKGKPQSKCDEIRALGSKKLRTRVTKGNLEFDGLWLTQWDTRYPEKKSLCSSCKSLQHSSTFPIITHYTRT